MSTQRNETIESCPTEQYTRLQKEIAHKILKEMAAMFALSQGWFMDHVEIVSTLNPHDVMDLKIRVVPTTGQYELTIPVKIGVVNTSEFRPGSLMMRAEFTSHNAKPYLRFVWQSK